MLTSKERIALTLAHREPDRVALYDSVWGTTVARWRREGLPAGMSPDQYFDYDLAGAGFDRGIGVKPETLEETDTYVISRDSFGAVTRNWRGRESTPEQIDFLIKDRAAWNEHRPGMRPHEGRVNWRQLRAAHDRAQAQGRWFAFNGSFGFQLIFSRIVGPVTTLMAMAEEPDWAREMFEAVADQTIGMAEIMLGAGLQFDGAQLADDLGYRNASLMSPAMYRELIMPAHRRVCNFFKGRGLPVIHHCCGNAMALLPDLIGAGIAAINPLEVKAGMDLFELKRRYGDAVTLIGGIDVRNWATGDDRRIEAEIAEKVAFARKGGGYIFHSDHSVPDNVSLATYRQVVEWARRHGACQA